MRIFNACGPVYLIPYINITLWVYLCLCTDIGRLTHAPYTLVVCVQDPDVGALHVAHAQC